MRANEELAPGARRRDAGEARARAALAAALLALACGACGPGRPAHPPPTPPVTVSPPSSTPPTAPPEGPGLPGAIRLGLPGGTVALVPLEDYVGGVVAGELAVGSLDRRTAAQVLALQTVLARTYAWANLGRHAKEGFDLCTTTHCQVYRLPERVLPANRPAIDEAVRRTAGQALTYGGRPAQALFHADCGGRTSAAERIWGGDSRPYLVSVTDETCARAPSSAWRFTRTRDEIRVALNKDRRTSVGARLEAISIVARDEAGRVELAALDGERSPIVRGEELRAAINRQFGDRSIRSPLFTVSRDGDHLVFAGRGWGHGAGLCQRGAAARLLAGASFGQVLATYYPGTVLTRPRLPATTSGSPPADRQLRSDRAVARSGR